MLLIRKCYEKPHFYSDMPKAYKSIEDYLEHTSHRLIEVALMPENNPEIERRILAEENLPDMAECEAEFMKDYSGEMTSPGCKEVVRGVMDADPAEPPEFDLPDCEFFREQICLIWADKFLATMKNPVSKYAKYDIYSLDLSSDDRYYILEFADDYYEKEVGKWPDDEKIFDNYAKYYDPYEEY